MNRRSLVLLAVLAVIPIAACIAIAAPSGVTPETHVAGAHLPKRVNVNADGIKFQTKRRTDVSVLTLTVAPGGSTGWHSHPGLAIISVASGTGKLYLNDCASRSYGPGQAFVEAGNDPPTLFTNESSSPVVLTVTFVAPRGAAIIRERTGPVCGRR